MARIVRTWLKDKLASYKEEESTPHPNYLVFELETDALDIDESIANPPKKPRLMSCPSEVTRVKLYGLQNCCESFGIEFYGADLKEAKYVYEKGFLHDMKTLPDFMPKYWVCERDSNNNVLGWGSVDDSRCGTRAEGVYFVTDIGTAVVTVENSHNGYYRHDFAITGVNGQSADGMV